MQQSICEIRRNSSVISINSTFKNKLFLTSVIHLTYLTHVILSTHFSNLATSPFHSPVNQGKQVKEARRTYLTIIFTGYIPNPRAFSGAIVNDMRPFLSVTSVLICCQSPPGGSRMMWMSTFSPEKQRKEKCKAKYAQEPLSLKKNSLIRCIHKVLKSNNNCNLLCNTYVSIHLAALRLTYWK